MLAQATYRQGIIDAMNRPAEAVKQWHEYRPIFINDARINGGIAFYRQNRVALDRIAAETGVPAEYIVAIIGVETSYGRVTGSYKVIDALYTLAFDFPRRAPFFAGELAQLFALQKAEPQLDILELKGSYAGAMGMGQFMPSSFRPGEGRRRRRAPRPDHALPDVFASIANYFAVHGWERDGPVVARADRADGAGTSCPRLDPIHPLAELERRGYARARASRASKARPCSRSRAPPDPNTGWLPQLLRHHPLQPLADVRAIRAPAGAGDPAGKRGGMRAGWLAVAVLLLAACSGAPKKPDVASPPVVVPPQPPVAAGVDCAGFVPYAPAQEDPSTRGDYVAGGLYKPGVRDSVPSYIPNVACIPEPVVVHEPPSRHGNRSPYTVLGRSYHVRDSAHGFVETGIASYYGNKFHGRRTSNQEVYDMYAFTAAHKSLPLPSYARVTNLDNGRSVVVRVNDRGPFHRPRI